MQYEIRQKVESIKKFGNKSWLDVNYEYSCQAIHHTAWMPQKVFTSLSYLKKSALVKFRNRDASCWQMLRPKRVKKIEPFHLQSNCACSIE